MRSIQNSPIHSSINIGQFSGTRNAFTLIELLVVVTVIGLLVALLTPTVGHVLTLARGSKSLAQLRQLSLGVTMYALGQKGFLPAGAYPSPPTPRIRWIDAIWPYMEVREMYISPQLTTGDLARMVIPFAHDPTLKFGGYGYNYQYLGNGRHTATLQAPYNVPFHARTGAMLPAPSRTVLMSDTDGTKAEQTNNSSGQTMESPWSSNGVYVIDPPLGSRTLGSLGSRKAQGGPTASNYGYQGGADGVLKGENGALSSRVGDPTCRATPSPRNLGKVNAGFLDGHTEPMDPAALDDFDGDGNVDNGWWNGLGRVNVR